MNTLIAEVRSHHVLDHNIVDGAYVVQDLKKLLAALEKSLEMERGNKFVAEILSNLKNNKYGKCMKGSNTLELNEATVIEALQYYFDNCLFKHGQTPLVTSIKLSKNTASIYATTFEVTVNSEGAKKCTD